MLAIGEGALGFCRAYAGIKAGQDKALLVLEERERDRRDTEECAPRREEGSGGESNAEDKYKDREEEKDYDAANGAKFYKEAAKITDDEEELLEK